MPLGHRSRLPRRRPGREAKPAPSTIGRAQMSHVRFWGRRTTAGPRVWRTDNTGRFLLSGPAKENRTLPRYGWGDDSNDTLDLAVDLLCSIRTPTELAVVMAPELAVGVLCALPDEWELTGAQLAHWRDTVPTFEPAILPQDW